MHQELSNSIDTIGILTFYFFVPSALSSSRRVKHTAGILGAGWGPLSFYKGKKLVILGLALLSVVWFHGLWDGSMESSFSTSLAAHR